MKTRATAGALGILGLTIVSGASAEHIAQNSANFTSVNAADITLINHSAAGVSNLDTSARKLVVATPPRTPHVSGTQVVSITGWNFDRSVNTCCTITTYARRGDLILSQSFCVNDFNATWTRDVEFSTSAAPVDSAYNVVCSLAPNERSRIQSVRIIDG